MDIRQLSPGEQQLAHVACDEARKAYLRHAERLPVKDAVVFVYGNASGDFVISVFDVGNPDYDEAIGLLPLHEEFKQALLTIRHAGSAGLLRVVVAIYSSNELFLVGQLRTALTPGERPSQIYV